MVEIELIEGGTVTTPKGFNAGGAFAGIKKPGKGVLDLGIIYSEEPCVAAAVFTTNKIKSAAVVVNQERLAKKGYVSAVVVNSGCANSSTGEQGLKDAYKTTDLVGKALGIEPEEVLVGSTGVIGVRLPMDKIRDGIRDVVITPDGGHTFERAIMTTDTVPKEIGVRVTTSAGAFSIGGVAKGSGMIHPNLATMLVYITTDASIDRELLQKALKDAVAVSFNMITVDGDTSPSDTVLVLANGMSKAKITGNGEPAKAFRAALTTVCIELAKSIARDGEGATHLLEVTVNGAKSVTQARRAARTIAGSNLVKAAVYGRDPNWGRVTAALGRSEIEIDEPKLDVTMAGIPVLRGGSPVAFDHKKAVKALGKPEVQFEIDLHLGKAQAISWGCDLTERYVKINAEYTT